MAGGFLFDVGGRGGGQRGFLTATAGKRGIAPRRVKIPWAGNGGGIKIP
jgi:hypothetical protein